MSGLDEDRSMRVVVGIVLLLAACTPDPKQSMNQSAVGSACIWMGGTWQWNGCGEAQCVMYQDNCDVHMVCSSTSGGEHFGDGTLSGNVYSFNTYCAAMINGHNLSGQCVVGSTTQCTFSATHP